MDEGTSARTFIARANFISFEDQTKSCQCGGSSHEWHFERELATVSHTDLLGISSRISLSFSFAH